METAGRLAHNLDQRMLARNLLREVATGQGRRIAAPGTPDTDLLVVPGVIAAIEIGDRYVIRYLTAWSIRTAPLGSSDPTFVSPTPFTPTEAAIWFSLPGAEPRSWYVLLDLRLIDWVQGPRYEQFGGGLEYLLPNGYPEAAVVAIASRPGTRWALRIT